MAIIFVFTSALFSSKKYLDFDIVVFSFLFDKYYLIIDAQKIHLVIYSQTVQLVFVFIYI